MNIPRRTAALKREIEYRRNELDRIERLRAAGEPTVISFPEHLALYIDEIRKGIADREAEIRRLQG